MNLELNIDEAKLDEFSAWFAENNPPPAKVDVRSFTGAPGGVEVVYRVIVSVRSEAAAKQVRAAWG